MDAKDIIEAGSDLSATELRAAVTHLRERLRDHGKLTGCTSYVQRRMGIGYNHAARIMDYLESAQIITAPDNRGERRFV